MITKIAKHCWFTLAALIALSLSAGSVLAQTSSGTTIPTPAPGQGQKNFEATKSFDRFLDHHPAVARELNENPSLINDPNYLSQHPELQEFLTKHPGIQKAAQKDPRALIRHERRFDRAERRHGRGRRPPKE